MRKGVRLENLYDMCVEEDEVINTQRKAQAQIFSCKDM